MKRNTTWGMASGGALVIGAAAFLAGRALAVGIPASQPLVYTGLLQNADGSPLSGSGHKIEIKLWSDASATAIDKLLCDTSAQALVTDSTGHFSQTLGDDCTKGIAASPDAYVEVLLDGTPLGDKRGKLGAVPYAVEAARASAASEATNAASGGGIAKAIGDLQSSVAALQRAALTNVQTGVVAIATYQTQPPAGCEGLKDVSATNRSCKLAVTFPTPFAEPPVVNAGFTTVDISTVDTDTRLSLAAGEVTTTGFSLTVGTWAGNVVNYVVVQWTAVGR